MTIAIIVVLVIAARDDDGDDAANCDGDGDHSGHLCRIASNVGNVSNASVCRDTLLQVHPCQRTSQAAASSAGSRLALVQSVERARCQKALRRDVAVFHLSVERRLNPCGLGVLDWLGKPGLRAHHCIELLPDLT